MFLYFRSPPDISLAQITDKKKRRIKKNIFIDSSLSCPRRNHFYSGNIWVFIYNSSTRKQSPVFFRTIGEALAAYSSCFLFFFFLFVISVHYLLCLSLFITVTQSYTHIYIYWKNTVAVIRILDEEMFSYLSRYSGAKRITIRPCRRRHRIRLCLCQTYSISSHPNSRILS